MYDSNLFHPLSCLIKTYSSNRPTDTQLNVRVVYIFLPKLTCTIFGLFSLSCDLSEHIFFPK
nr:MAG TPA: hypothetical protein [Crassvirales sp.]